jgi:hypothetical protein
VCQSADHVPARRLNLIPPAEQVLEQIRKRDRKNELEASGNIDDGKRHTGYAWDRTKHGWQHFSDHETIEETIANRLAMN